MTDDQRIRAGLWRIGGWRVEKRGAYWGVWKSDSPWERVSFSAKTLREIREWIEQEKS